MKKLPFRRALILAAHPDDEFGCLGTVARLAEEGAEIHYLAFSPCTASIPEGFPDDVLLGELKAAMAVAGVPEDHITLRDYPVRHFPRLRQEILEELVAVRKELDPDLVICPALSDIHQDHQVVAREGLRAFKFASVLGFELPMNTIAFAHACFVELTQQQMDKKIGGLAKYESQAFRPYANADFLRSLARVRGVQVNTTYAEAFEAVRLSF
jgi:LmbE family N-acetylglucosaminyl deacetylase